MEFLDKFGEFYFKKRFILAFAYTSWKVKTINIFFYHKGLNQLKSLEMQKKFWNNFWYFYKWWIEFKIKNLLISLFYYFIRLMSLVTLDIKNIKLYRDFNEYQWKLQTWGLILNNIWDKDILKAHSARSEFYLDVQRRDHELRENTLKPIAEKVMENIGDLRDEFNQRNYDINSKVNQAKELNQKSLFETEEQIRNLIYRLKEDYDAQLNTIKRELNDQKKEYWDMNKIIIHQHNDFKKELSEINNKLRDLDNFQKYHEKKTNDSELSNKTQHDVINARLSEIIKCIEELNSKQEKQEKFCQNEFASILTSQSKINEEFEENRINQTKKNQSLHQSLTQRIDEVCSNFNKQMFNNSSVVQNLTKDLANFKDQLLNSNNKNDCLSRF